jgi:ATP-dependent DNA helicase DinG
MSSLVEHWLGADGPIATALGGSYEPRAEQMRMAQAVEKTLQDRSHLLVEAGTGTGKSFAYLVPVLRRAVEHGERVVISTHTIALQEQLMNKDIPLLTRVMAEHDERPLRSVLVKGRGNYVSLRRLSLASSRQETLFPDHPSRRSLHAIEDWAYETKDGSLASLPVLERPGVWDRVQSDSGNCMGRKCPTYERCFYQQARRAMEQADVLVCNHALFFSDLALRSGGHGFLPDYKHVVLDEAHQIEDVAAEHFGISISEGRVSHVLNSLYQPRTGKGFLASLRTTDAGAAGVEVAVRWVLECQRVADQMFDELAAKVTSGKLVNGRVRQPNIVEDRLGRAMSDLTLALRGLREVVHEEADRYELNGYAERTAALADGVEALITQSEKDFVYWVDVAGRGGPMGARGTRVTFAASPVDVAPLLKQELFAAEWSTVLTSATLATRSVHEDDLAEYREAGFSHLINRLGADGAQTLQLGSPFDLSSQMEVFIDRSIAAPARFGDDQGQRKYENDLVTRILEHVGETDGGAFVLFTSYALLYRLADLLEAPLQSLGMPMLVQGRKVPRGELLEMFRSDERSVLLGAASFWQGVDVQGHGLRNVIITRLPFEPPDRPLTEARLERIREQGGDPFREDSLPRAVIRFKQGIGRLIRSAEDRGRVVVLDPRILTAGYGRAFLSVFPPELEPTVIG